MKHSTVWRMERAGMEVLSRKLPFGKKRMEYVKKEGNGEKKKVVSIKKEKRRKYQ